MHISADKIGDWIAAVWSDGTDVIDYADGYGEPGYRTGGDGSTPMVILGNYWIRETDPKYRPTARNSGLISWDDRYPRIMAQLQSQGVEFEWYDEWTVVHQRGTSLAYRTTHDSYGWQPTALYGDGEMWVPDPNNEDDIRWLCEEHANSPHTAINCSLVTVKVMERHGWTQCDDYFENGWHPGQDDDPKVILPIWQERYPDHDFVFVITGVGQFDIRFRLFRKLMEGITE
jgi:hypothetical protein